MSDEPVTGAAFAAVMRVSYDCIAIARLRDGKILDVNEGFTRVTGYERRNVVGRTAPEVGLWMDPESRDHFIGLVSTQSSIHDFEAVLRHKSGAPVYCNVSAHLFELDGEPCIVSVARDETERRRTEATNRRLTAIIEATTDFVGIVDPEERLLYINRAGRRMVGFADDEDLTGMLLTELHPEHVVERLRTEARPIVRSGDVWTAETALRTRDGREIPVLQVAMGHFSDSGEITHLSTIARDITELKKIEGERLAMIRDLEAKNSELERFAYTVSHDLKSPLVTIRGFLGFLTKDLAADKREEVNQDIEAIEKAAIGMQKLLDEILELSRLGRQINPNDEVDLAALAREATDLLAGEIAVAGLEFTIDPELPIVLGDRPRLLEVYQNLIGNAVKFMGEQDVPRLEIGQRRDGGDAVFFVADNGMGIDKPYHETVFELFQRLEASVDGTGIGLALVKRIIELHGGRIWVESAGSGRGSTFCFTLKRPDSEP